MRNYLIKLNTLLKQKILIEVTVMKKDEHSE